MSLSPRIPINDELLSAYIDGELTDAEKAAVETAIAQDPHVAWQVESLQQTVLLLSELPPIPLPRSFTLDEDAFREGVLDGNDRAEDFDQSVPGASAQEIRTPKVGGFWHNLAAFLNSGNPLLRNAAAVAALLFLILWVGDPHQGVLPLTRSGQQTSASLPAPLAAEPETTAAETEVSVAASNDLANDTMEEPPAEALQADSEPAPAEPVEAPAMAEVAEEPEVSPADSAPGFEAAEVGLSAGQDGRGAGPAEPGAAASLVIPAEGGVESVPLFPEVSQARAMPRPTIMVATEPAPQTYEDVPAPASGPAQAESAEVQAMAIPDAAEMSVTESPANPELEPEMAPAPGITDPPAVAESSAEQAPAETLPLREQPAPAAGEGVASETRSGSRSQPGILYPLQMSSIWSVGRIAAVLLSLVLLLFWWNSRRAVGR